MDEELELLKEKVKFLEEQLNTLKKRIEKYENMKSTVEKDENDSPKHFSEKKEKPLTINEIEEEENRALPVEKNVEILESKYGKLKKVSNNSYKTLDNKNGFIILNSKSYYETNCVGYWYAYREKKFRDISDCDNQFLVLGFGNPLKMCVIPNDKMQELKDNLTYTADDGIIRHYHIYLKEENDLVTMRLSKPELKKLSMSNYLFK